MLKKIVAITAMLFAVASWAAVDANKASDAELDSLRGVGPALSKRIVEARKQGEFKDWPDFMSRVKGVKEKAATKLSAEGLTVNGQSFGNAHATAKVARNESRKADKPAGKP
ncbi:helix-hairpin-helix domain-containing protein [Variovorax sp. J22R115]|uniref:ComEA family DNA-binding protein n=1 Tax=Variovorax sp. J22R115 TaxID=3053509 RepID=UPI0025750786|nr:helix-hairpin-helix domain-containing protein [Variovorax sp. J22R115]MDM0050815.1 helix-hairpin-helix domain-containing protein [Variovorax sp. J22R115]